MNKVFVGGDIDLVNGAFRVNGSQIAMASLSDGSSYSTTAQRNAVTDGIQTEVDVNTAKRTYPQSE